jgi:hypothetical protein
MFLDNVEGCPKAKRWTIERRAIGGRSPTAAGRDRVVGTCNCIGKCDEQSKGGHLADQSSVEGWEAEPPEVCTAAAAPTTSESYDERRVAAAHNAEGEE